MKNENEELIEYALKAKEYSYSPYSKFRVGAAVLTKDKRIFTGCNIENSAYSATICAERTAIYKAISEGCKDLEKIAIVSDAEEFTYPCGECRQVLSEFMKDGEVILSNKYNEIKQIKFETLLPFAFELKND